LDQNQDRIQDAARVFAAIAEALEGAAAPVIAETGLPTSQIRVLYKLHYEREASIGRIAEHLDVGLPTASYHVEQLVEAGLVERRESKTDRRSKVISLTPTGHAMINRFLQAPLDLMVRWLSQLQSDDMAKLSQGLKALAQVSQELEDDAHSN